MTCFCNIPSHFSIVFRENQQIGAWSPCYDRTSMSEVVIIANLLGFAGVLFLGFSTLGKNRKNILKLNVVGDILYATAAFLIWSPAAMIVNIAALFRDGLGSLGKLTPLRNLLLTGTGVVVGALANVRGVWGILPLVATTEYAICLSVAKRPQTLRAALAFNMSLWLVHDFAVGLFMAGIVDGLSVLIMIFGLIHFRSRKRGSKRCRRPVTSSRRKK